MNKQKEIEVLSWNETSLPTVVDIKNKYLKNLTFLKANEGGMNIVETFLDNEKKEKIVLRISKAEIAIKRKKDKKAKIVIKNESQREVSERNWELASKLELSPRIYFYGYVMKQISSSTYIYPCIVSEGYDLDLHYYYQIYDKRKKQITKNDKKIQSQLTELLNKISSAPFSSICYDIKPSNSVIKLSNLKVKLIDWDGDWCLQPDILKTNDKKITELTGILSNMIMANHFYIDMEKNIFADYFIDLKNNHKLDKKKKDLKKLLCQHTCINDIHYHSYYSEFIDHYFKKTEEDDEVSLRLDKNLTCEKAFDIMYERCFLINPIL